MKTNGKWHFYLVIAIMLSTSFMFNPARADNFQDTARVMNVVPHMTEVRRPVCRTVEVQVPRQQQERGYMGGGIGGAAGALLGSQVGGGSGNKVAIAAAAVTGTIAGDRMQNGGDPSRGVAGAAIGGTAGALLGNQIGGGNGNKAAIALGAILGAAAGDHVQNGQQATTGPAMETRMEQVCEQQMTREQSGYDVTYEFDGRSRTTWMQRDPGRYVSLDINVR